MNNVKRHQEVFLFATIGALIGGCVTSGMVLVLFQSEPRFRLETLLIFGSVGLIGGAIGGVLVTIRERSWLGVAIGGVVGGVGCCILLTIGMLWYPGVPWPSPRPYPDTEFSTSQGAIGSWGLSRSQWYDVHLSLEDVQNYYEMEMKHYCVDSWQFETPTDPDLYSRLDWSEFHKLPEYITNSQCRESQCQIRRWWLAQSFSVLLCEEKDSQTIVIQEDSWED